MQKIFSCDTGKLSTLLSTCSQCQDISEFYLRVSPPPQYRLAYTSTTNDSQDPAFQLKASDLHFFVTAEIHEMFGPDAWNGFKAVYRPDDIPPIYETSVPDVMWRQDYLVNGLILISSLIASGIIGGLSYDALKRATKALWERIPSDQITILNKYAKNSAIQKGDDFQKIFEGCFIYLRRRLKGLELLSDHDGELFLVADHFRTEAKVTISSIMKVANCDRNNARLLLKLLNAEYSRQERRWLLPSDRAEYYLGTKDQNFSGLDNTITMAFHTHGSGRETAWNLCIPEPPDFTDDQAMDYEVEVTQAATPDIEAYLKEEITGQQLQHRVNIKAKMILDAINKRMKKNSAKKTK